MKRPPRSRPERALALLIALAALVPASACARGEATGGKPSAAPAATAAPAAASPITSGPRVLLPSGKSVAVEVAVTDAEKAQGLMFRESMPRDRGMVFLFDVPEIRPFWMKNCHFALDMIYTLKDGTIVDVLKNVPPCADDPCPSYPPKAKADTVVEVNAGVADAEKAVTGAKLRYLEIPGR